jgi:V8-like Glu-specific endopeptidase
MEAPSDDDILYLYVGQDAVFKKYLSIILAFTDDEKQQLLTGKLQEPFEKAEIKNKKEFSLLADKLKNMAALTREYRQKNTQLLRDLWRSQINPLELCKKSEQEIAQEICSKKVNCGSKEAESALVDFLMTLRVHPTCRSEGAAAMKTSDTSGQEVALFHYGEDVRTQAASSDRLPNSAIGLLVIKIDIGTFVGTGAMVGRNVILTAAHNLVHHTASSKPPMIRFLPAEHKGSWFPEPTISGIYIPDEYKTDQSEDYAIIVINEPLGDHTGFLEMTALTNKQLLQEELCIIGYPRDKNEKTTTVAQWEGRGQAVGGDSNFIRYYIDTDKGQSGSPVVFQKGNKYHVVGVHVIGDKTEGVNKATRITEARIKKITEYLQSQKECTILETQEQKREHTESTREFWGFLSMIPWGTIAIGAAKIAVKVLSKEDTKAEAKIQQDVPAKVSEGKKEMQETGKATTYVLKLKCESETRRKTARIENIKDLHTVMIKVFPKLATISYKITYNDADDDINVIDDDDLKEAINLMGKCDQALSFNIVIADAVKASRIVPQKDQTRPPTVPEYASEPPEREADKTIYWRPPTIREYASEPSEQEEDKTILPTVPEDLSGPPKEDGTAIEEDDKKRQPNPKESFYLQLDKKIGDMGRVELSQCKHY